MTFIQSRLSRRCGLALATALCPIVFGSADIARAQDGAAEAVHAAFNGYKTALRARRGAAAAAHVTDGTLAYYERMRTTALTAGRNTIATLSDFDRFTVLRLRHAFGGAGLRARDGRALFVAAVETGIIGNIGDIDLDKIEVAGDEARAVSVRGSQVRGAEYQFAKAPDGTWRFDLVRLFKLADMQLETERRASGVSREKYAIDLLRRIVGEPIPESIWTPPGAK